MTPEREWEIRKRARALTRRHIREQQKADRLAWEKQMTRQPHLFDSQTATVRSTQGRLFDPQDVAAGDSGLSCSECGRPMVRTASGYLVCPAGHGRLLEEIGDVERSGNWFEDTEGE